VVVKELGTPSTYPSPAPVPTENLFASDTLIDVSSLIAAVPGTSRRGPIKTDTPSQPLPQPQTPSGNVNSKDTKDKSIPATTGSRPGSITEIETEVASSIKSSIFTPSGSSTWAHLPGRYVIVAAGSSIKCILGLQESIEFTVSGLDQADEDFTGSTNLEIVSMDAFERKDERGCQLVVLVSIAKVTNGVHSLCCDYVSDCYAI
jgi:hypothetical protein